MKVLVTLPLLLLSAPESDRFNCPQPNGQLSFDELAINNAWPSHIDKILPSVVDVDFRCKVDGEGGFADCIFVSRQDLTENQERIVQRVMPRIMGATRTDVPNQPCVASKITFKQGDTVPSSKPPPDEPAAERVIPH